MNYLIASVINGEAGEFNKRLTKEISDKFELEYFSSLPPHITIKAPFYYKNDITQIEEAIEYICKYEKSHPYSINRYGTFSDRILYMKIDMSREAKETHDKLVDKLNEIDGINFDKQDGKDKVFHGTLVKNYLKDKSKEIWDFANLHQCNFVGAFDNICIYKREDNRWKIYKEYFLSNK